MDYIERIERRERIKRKRRKRIMRFISFVVSVTVIIGVLYLFIDGVRFTEKYSTQWNYQLKNELRSHDVKKEQWYAKHYIEQNELLWYNDLDERLVREYYNISEKDWETTYNTLRWIHGNDFTKKDFLKYILKEGVNFDEINH